MSDILDVSGEHAGVHLLLTFHNGLSEKELLQRAAKEDALEEKPTILLGYANLTEEQIREAVEILERCFRCSGDQNGTK